MRDVVFGAAPSFHQEWHAYLASTHAYKALARLPLSARVKNFFYNRTDEILSYSSELLIILILAGALLTGYDGAGARSKSIKADFLKIVTHPDFLETAEELCPRLFGWYAFFAPIQRRTSLEARRVVYEARSAKSNFRALFARSPREAVMLYRAELLRRGEGRLPKPPSGCVRLYFYINFERGKSRDQWAFPDATLDLPVKEQGVNLSLARKTWGLESIAVITNAESFKTVFHPANEDWLSPLATYDLSRQFKQPIRVFEPRVNKFTRAERVIRGLQYPLIFFLLSFIKLLLGFPEPNTAYLSVLYGPRYASLYERAAHYTPSIKDWFVTGGFLFLQLAIILAVLPFAVVYNATLALGKFACWTSLAAYSAPLALGKVACWTALAVYGACFALARFGVNLVVSVSSTAVSTATLFASLQIRHWLALLGVAWWGLAEYRDAPGQSS